MYKLDQLTEKELRRLSRKELLLFLLDQAKQTEALELELEALKERHKQEMEAKVSAWEKELATQKELSDAKIEILTLRLENNRNRRRTAWADAADRPTVLQMLRRAIFGATAPASSKKGKSGKKQSPEKEEVAYGG